MARWLKFLIAIALGIAAGMLYGWVVSPVEYVDTTPDSLREDYKADFVLMVAEAYQAEDDLGWAARRLGILGDLEPTQIVAQAVAFALKNGYSPADLVLMQKLAEDIQSWNPSWDAPIP